MLLWLSENHCGKFETSEITVFIFSPGTNLFAVRVNRKVKPIWQKQRMSIIKWEMAAPEFPLLWYMFLKLISENWNIKQEFSTPELSPFQHIFLHYLAEIFWIPGVHIFILLISIVKSPFTLHYILFIVVGAPCLHLFLNKADKQISSTLTSLFIQIEWILMPEWSWWKSYSMNFKTNVPRVAQGWDQVGLVVHEVAQLVLHHRLPQLILEHEDPFLLQTDRVIGGSLKWNNCKF